jgi:Putative zinc-finger
MEGAPLRPVPLRPAGPVDADAATAHVAALLPRLDEPARRALALVELGGADRADAADQLDLGLPATAAALARGRKALRRSLFPLAASGWCERAEGLLSDRMDGELPVRGAARLDAHLANCDRCQTHDLRLAQALDMLGRTFVVASPPQTPQLAAGGTELPRLQVVDPVAFPGAEAEGTAAGEGADAAAPSATPWRTLFFMACLFALAATIVAVLALTRAL